ncbi:MAG: methionine synthase [Micropruina sp.]|uniref:methionine synthase n=1 Tax=Micropruina sp. TaxID=2737536 RepID=UPI0039E40CC2
MVGVTGAGSLPGTDFPAAVRLVMDVLGGDGGIPHLPELPARGPWASLIGRGTAVLTELPVELVAGEWRLGDHPGIDQRRAQATLRDDLDRFEEEAHDYTGTVKLQVAGPWTLAASLFLPLGGRVLGDRAARRDLAQSLADGVAELLAQARRRLPSATIVLQLDEPSLPAVLNGAVPTEGGYFRHRAVHPPEVAEALRPLAEATASGVLHCCAPGLGVDLVRAAGFGAVALDQDLIADVDALAQAVDDGLQLYLGCLPTAGAARDWRPDDLVRRVLGLLRPLELGPVLADRLVLTPACGLAGFSPRQASSALAALRRASELVDEALRQ